MKRKKKEQVVTNNFDFYRTNPSTIKAQNWQKFKFHNSKPPANWQALEYPNQNAPTKQKILPEICEDLPSVEATATELWLFRQLRHYSHWR